MSMTAADWMNLSYLKMRNHNAHDPECRMVDMVNLVRTWAVCADGTIISLQGSPYHYSSPKEFTSKCISTGMSPWMMSRDSSVSTEAL